MFFVFSRSNKKKPRGSLGFKSASGGRSKPVSICMGNQTEFCEMLELLFWRSFVYLGKTTL